VAVTGTRGSPPPDTLKVALNMLGGYRNTTTMVLTGLDIEAKAAHAEKLLFDLLGGADQFDEVDVRLLRFDHPDAARNEEATAHLRITVKDQDEAKAGRGFSNVTQELALGGYAGFHTTGPPTAASAYGIYWPAFVPAGLVTQTVHLPDGTEQVVPHTPGVAAGPQPSGYVPAPVLGNGPAPAQGNPPGPAESSPARVAVPLGRIVGARSGDKGGSANVGLWARDDRAYEWLRRELTVDRFRELLTEAAHLGVQRYELPNLRALNFVVAGLLAPGVAATTRPDAQAKGLGEYLRSRVVSVPRDVAEEVTGA
jgi:hypothetical protein